jgi:hypothetical protein
MALRMHRAKRDSNEAEIFDALRAAGASVYRLDQPTDAVLGYRGKTLLIEIKMPGALLNENQKRFFAEWKGQTPPILRSVDDALTLLESMNG